MVATGKKKTKASSASRKPGSALLVPKTKKKKVIGWREWVRLPDLGIKRIKAKIDTGARTSALHAARVTPFTKDGAAYVRFIIHPLQRRRTPEVVCTALVIDHRNVTDSGGHSELRYIIRTTLKLGKRSWPVEFTLTNRDQMGFRMLVGRQALRRRYQVDPGRSFVTRKKKAKKRTKKISAS